MVRESFAKRLMGSLAALAVGVSLIAGCAQPAQQGTAPAATETEAEPAAEAEATTDATEATGEVTDTRDILASWDPECEAYKRLTSFVESVVDPTSDQYLPPEERIVTTDMDGTFIHEKPPVYLDRTFAIWHVFDDPTYDAPEDLKERVIAGVDSYFKGTLTPEGEFDFNNIIADAYKGRTPEELMNDMLRYTEEVDVVGFSGMKYSESFYKPMLEVIDYLRANDFDVWVVSATERFLARSFTGKYAGFAPDHVIASDFFIHGEDQDTEDGLDYTLQQDEDLVISGREISENGKTNKCISILNQIGRRPILAFGNSSGDYAMLNYATSNPDHEGIGFLVLCDDTVREYGDLDRATKQEKEAEDNGWVTISMAKDWSTIYGEGVEKTEYPTSIEDIQALAALDEAA